MLQIPERKQPTIPKIESPEGYYEEAEPFDTSINGMSETLGPEGLTAMAHRLLLTHDLLTGSPWALKQRQAQ